MTTCPRSFTCHPETSELRAHFPRRKRQWRGSSSCSVKTPAPQSSKSSFASSRRSFAQRDGRGRGRGRSSDSLRPLGGVRVALDGRALLLRRGAQRKPLGGRVAAGGLGLPARGGRRAARVREHARRPRAVRPTDSARACDTTPCHSGNSSAKRSRQGVPASGSPGTTAPTPAGVPAGRCATPAIWSSGLTSATGTTPTPDRVPRRSDTRTAGTRSPRPCRKRLHRASNSHAPVRMRWPLPG